MDFGYKICRSCGEKFNGDLDICESCKEEFKLIEVKLKSDEHKEFLRYCKYCGRPFIGGCISSRKGRKYFQPTKSEYCKGIDDSKIHYTQCQCCGSAVVNNSSGGNWPNKSSCSRKCLNILKREHTIQTNLRRYGVESVLQVDSVKGKIKQTNLERYGVECYLQKGPTRNIADAKMREKYKVESNISQNPDIRAKIDKTMEDKYGGYLNASEEFSSRSKIVSLERYGTEFPQQSEEVKKKTKQTIKDRYGVDNLMQSAEILDRMQRNSLEKYGVLWPTQAPKVIEKRRNTLINNYAETITDDVKRKNYLDFMNDPIEYVKSHFDFKPTLRDVKDSIGGLDDSTIYFRLGDSATELLNRIHSNMELDLCEFIKSVDSSIIIQENVRTIIKPKEIDIYLPEYKFGIECNPTATHNSSIPFMDIDIDVTPVNYHKDKTDLCEFQDIFLFHIFGYEWTWKRDIIQSMIRSVLGKNESKYFARNLNVVELDQYECKNFLVQNHRQGYTISKVRLGLKTKEGLLVSVMTFDKSRFTMGKKSYDTEQTWELSRFCSLLNTSVIGGASKLFKYFIRNYNFDKVVSFSDRSHTRGSLYETLGFQEVNRSDPNYVWVRYSDDIYYNRVSCQKRNLPKLLNEPDLDIENQTEKQIMVTHGFVQVFDSGNIRWEYTK